MKGVTRYVRLPDGYNNKASKSNRKKDRYMKTYVWKMNKDEKDKIFNALLPKIKDEYPGVRSKAIRSLGRFATNGFLSEEQVGDLKTALIDILGKSGDFIWDSAFIVRREAEAVYKQLTGNEE